MSEKSLTHGIKFKDKIGYAMGDMGGLLTFSLIGAFQNKFYTDVLHIQPAKIVVLILVARLWDAINDPIWGAFIDSRRPTKQGKFRPYVFWFSIPLAVSAVLMFTVIPNLSEAKYLLFAYITYILYGMMYTCVNIPYGSLASVVTDDEKERSSLSMWRSIGAGIGGLMAAEYLKARGHNPTVYEATDAPGGHFVLAGKAPKKQAFTDAVMWDAEECKRMGIEIKTGVTVTPELIKEVKPDHVIVATGAHFVKPNIPGLDTAADVFVAEDVLAGKAMPHGETIILGGGGVGCGDDIVDAANAGADAVACAAVLHYKKETVTELKEDIRAGGVEVRQV